MNCEREEREQSTAKYIQEGDLDGLDASIRIAELAGHDTSLARRARAGLMAKHALSEYARCVLMSPKEAAGAQLALSEALFEAKKYETDEKSKLEKALEATQLLIAQAKERQIVRASAILAATVLDDASIAKLEDQISQNMAHTNSEDSCLATVKRMRDCERAIESAMGNNRDQLRQALLLFESSLDLILAQDDQNYKEWQPSLIARCRGSPSFTTGKKTLQRLDREQVARSSLQAAIAKRDEHSIKTAIDAALQFTSVLSLELNRAESVLKEVSVKPASSMDSTEEEGQVALIQNQIAMQLDSYKDKQEKQRSLDLQQYEQDFRALLEEYKEALAKSSQMSSTLEHSVVTVAQQLDSAQYRFKCLEESLKRSCKQYKQILNNDSPLQQPHLVRKQEVSPLWAAYVLAFIEYLAFLCMPFTSLILTCCATVALLFDKHSKKVKAKDPILSLPSMRLDRHLLPYLFSLAVLVWAADSDFIINSPLAGLFCSSPLAGLLVAFRVSHNPRSLLFMSIATIASIVTWCTRHTIVNGAAVLDSGIIIFLIMQQNSFVRLKAALLIIKLSPDETDARKINLTRDMNQNAKTHSLASSATPPSSVAASHSSTKASISGISMPTRRRKQLTPQRRS